MVPSLLGRMQELLLLGLIGVVYCVLLTAANWLWVLTGAERQHLSRLVQPWCSHIAGRSV
jgi:hypothetical protein